MTAPYPWVGTQVAIRVERLQGATEIDWSKVAPNGRSMPAPDGSVLCLFPRAEDALATALQLRREVGGSSLCIAVHVGEVTVDEAGSIGGPALAMLASLAAVGGPGQVVCSEALFALADGADEVACFEELGHHVLRTGGRPQPVRIVRDAGSGTAPTPGRSPQTAGRAPRFAGTSFVGREADLRELRSWCQDPLRRLVTIVGPGGCGKTRLASELLPSLDARIRGERYWVDLAGCHDALDSGRALLDAVRSREEPNRSTTETVSEVIGDAPSILVLDNCEHLLEVMVPVVDSLLGQCPQLRLLATSREPLGLAAEWPWRISPLPCPTLEQLGQTSLEELGTFAAVQLFVERARQVRPTFALTVSNSAAVGEVSARLDGIPLAIELAAARARAQSPERIASELDDRFRVLRGGTRSAGARHATMLASVEWSYGLLDPIEQATFRRLAVFPAEFGLEAAEAVAADGINVEQIDVLDIVSRLVDRSMIISVEDHGASGECRFRMLQTLRQYALDHCIDLPQLSEARDRHLEYYLAWIERLDGLCPSDETQERIEQEYLNLRGALEWSTGQPELAFRLLAQLAISWANLGHHADARRWGRPILDRGPGAHPERWATAVGYLCDTLMFAGDETVTELLPQAMEVAARAGDHATLSGCHAILGIFGRGDPLEHAVEALLHARACDNRFRFAVSALLVSLLRTAAGHLDEVAELRAEGLDAWRAIGNRSWQVQCALVGAMEPTIRGDVHRAVAGTLADAAHLIGTVEPCSMSMCASGLAYVGMLAEREDMVARAFELFSERGVQSAVAFVPSEFAKCRIVAALRQGGRDVDLGTVRELLASPWANWYEELGHAALLSCDRYEELEGLLAEKTPDGPYPACCWKLTGAHLSLHRDDIPAAEDAAYAALSAAQAGGYGLVLIDALETLAALTDDRVTFSRLLGIAAGRRDRSGYRFRYPHITRALGHRIDVADQDAFAAGAALDPDAALVWATRTRGHRMRPASGWASLTPTEQRVVQLVQAGQTNPEIGERLLMSRSTVKTHLAHIFSKLGVKSRAQLAAQASARDRRAQEA